MRIGAISRDHLLETDRRRYEAMEQGSTRLRHAIEDYWIARAHRRPIPDPRSA